MAGLKGIIALDIDGTITVEKHTVEKAVKDYLTSLIIDGWKLIFITGRTYSFARPILSHIEQEFYFSTQNGAALYDMPEQKCLKKHYLSIDILEKIDFFFKKTEGGILVESGKENGDICYYKPSDFSEEELEYLDFRIQLSPEKWKAIDSFKELPLQDFAVGKYFALRKEAQILKSQIQTVAPLNIVVIRDPFRPGYHLAHVNAPQASKGKILNEFAAFYDNPPIIGAGDDYNDEEMLKNSTVKVVMQNAPDKLRQMADIVAPHADEMGIIEGLEQAIWKVQSK
ncbi:MAG: Phosphatase YwpJ [Chlamydiales bacterium]|nr:Phosphatase YwpJ [Chlamydiales bacterium]